MLHRKTVNEAKVDFEWILADFAHCDDTVHRDIKEQPYICTRNSKEKIVQEHKTTGKKREEAKREIP